MTHYVKIKQDAVLEAVSEHTLESENHSDSLGREDFESNRRKLFELLELHHADQIMPKQIHVKLMELLHRGGYNIESYLQLYYSQQNNKNKVPEDQSATDDQKAQIINSINKLTDSQTHDKIGVLDMRNGKNQLEPKFDQFAEIKDAKKPRTEIEKRSEMQDTYEVSENLISQQEMDVLEQQLRSLQAAEEEVLNSYLYLDQLQNKKLLEETSIYPSQALSSHISHQKTKETVPRQSNYVAESRTPKSNLGDSKSFEKKDILSASSLSEIDQSSMSGSAKKEKKTTKSSLARMYLQKARAKASGSETEVTPSAGKHSTQQQTAKEIKSSNIAAARDKTKLKAEFKEQQTESEDTIAQSKIQKELYEKKHEAAIAKRPDRMKKVNTKPKKPLTLKDFREMAIKNLSQTTKNSEGNRSNQKQKFYASNPYFSPQAASTPYSWESLANSAKMRDEKVFAITPTQDYLILDRHQLIDNPQIKVLNTKAWADFLGTMAQEEEVDLPKPNFTIADDTVYRKNINWLIEKRRNLEERREKLEKQELDKCTFWPNLKRGEDGELYYVHPSRISNSRLNSSLQHAHSNSRSSSNRERSHSAARERKGFDSYSELREYKKNLQAATEKKFNFAGIITTRFLNQRSPVKERLPEKHFASDANHSYYNSETYQPSSNK